MREVLHSAFERSAYYLESLDSRSVAPTAEAIERLPQLGGAMPETPEDPNAVLALLDDIGSPATVATAGGRYFGFVIGGALPATLAANWLAGAWDQNAGMVVGSPVSAAIEEISLEWLKKIFHLPDQAGGAFVTGATMANFTGLAAARHALLKNAGWDVEADGLFDAPELRVVVGDEVHVSLLKALGLLGLGRARVEKSPVDDQGRMRAEALPTLDDKTILCIQAGNVNTGRLYRHRRPQMAQRPL